MIRIDMHVHSIYSDGAYTPDALACAAKSRGLTFITLTDHDTTEGLLDFEIACRRHGVQSLNGVELSAEAPYTLHILGYRIKPGVRQLERKLEFIREHRNQRNLEICRKLREHGLDIVYADVAAQAHGCVVARPHIALALMKKGYVSSVREAFAKYLSVGTPGYVQRERLTPRECVELILEAGGLPVLAHPAQTKLQGKDFDDLVLKLKDYGLWGLEAKYSKNSVYQDYDYMLEAKRFGLYPTAGSDFHGQPGQTIPLGIDVDENFLPWARLGLSI